MKIILPTSNSHDKSNENFDIASKVSITTDAYPRPINDVIYKKDDIIQNKPVSILHTKNMLDTHVTLDEKSQSFALPRKQNHSATEPSYQVPLVSDPLKFQQNITTHMVRQKLSPYGK